MNEDRRKRKSNSETENFLYIQPGKAKNPDPTGSSTQN